MMARLAPAKINLYLHVAAPDARGYHPLQSLVVFADIGDYVALQPTVDGLALHIEGPFGRGLTAGEDNLVMRAVRAFEAEADLSVDRHQILLRKNLPLASGLGGGSADAGACLHLLRQTYAPDMSDGTLSKLAGGLGADGVMCLWHKSGVADGYGEKLTYRHMPTVHAVLVNPLAQCSTAKVYAGYDDRGQFAPLMPQKSFGSIVNIDKLVSALSHTRNDLQGPAMRLQPMIATVLAHLEAQPETLFARMSGSGATCFALCEDAQAAETLRLKLLSLMPDAWVRTCCLGG
ncbi:MAG: 4-(cytidine 5'-diphospho)-2-C-methyl-D-erythritol kinase [Asticcacaulis sp.]